eukprot:CAMPEP_0173416076 /NCGR_PEP_ID=MMETSP1356-20130122/85206_1 /TAXON_ID=77927 ORGANISM="Hemiselmis virescens, Strain PCC157" /NCGR_SAMPLE_ID=MMETSP1356 /ASSEMBLY_ACC=CAM_ASM_000847 /LENGTH=158 /DNA_ID=CAMNT_0014378375 /DNA_START=451 /DNA_END=928 /DNA_ORIENTATION=-
MEHIVGTPLFEGVGDAGAFPSLAVAAQTGEATPLMHNHIGPLCSLPLQRRKRRKTDAPPASLKISAEIQLPGRGGAAGDFLSSSFFFPFSVFSSSFTFLFSAAGGALAFTRVASPPSSGWTLSSMAAGDMSSFIELTTFTGRLVLPARGCMSPPTSGV